MSIKSMLRKLIFLHFAASNNDVFRQEYERSWCSDRPVKREDGRRQQEHLHRDMDSHPPIGEPTWPHGQLRHPSGLRGSGGRDPRHDPGTSVLRGYNRYRGGPGLYHAGLRHWELSIYSLIGTLQKTKESHQFTHRQLGNIRLPGGHCVLSLSGRLLRGQAAVMGSWDCALRLH